MRPLLALLSAAALAGCIQPIKAECGGPGQACCSGQACLTGSECGSDQVCRACGRAGLSCCSGDACGPGEICSAAKVCLACGGDNQICCPGNRCGTGAECRIDGACHACGGLGQGCCANATCEGGLRCDNDSCVKPCGEGCAPGLKRCGANGGVDLCSYSAPPCTTWTSVIDRCPLEQVCQEGACVPRCPDACALGSTLCTSEGLKVCVFDDSSQCPAYQIAPDSPDNPTCLTGACDGQVCWESPLPQGNDLKAVDGWDVDQMVVLDHLGNLLKRGGDVWTYDRRTDSAGRVLALSGCGAPTRMYAVGERGLTLRRTSMGWASENIGDASARLTAVSCNGNEGVVAVGDGGLIFSRDPDSGAWRKLNSGTTKDLRGVARYFGPGEAWAVGAAGTVIHCTGLDTPSTTACALEATGLTGVNLNSVWVNGTGGDTGLGRGEVVAVGDDGVVLLRSDLGTWSRAAQGVTAGALRVVRGLPDGSVHAAGDRGTFVYRTSLTSSWYSEKFTTLDLEGVYAADKSHLTVVGASGAIWFNDLNGFQGQPPAQHWRQMGGKQPTDLDLLAIAGRGSADVYAVGVEGTVLHKSGDAWRHEARGLTAEELRGVTVVNADEAYAVGGEGLILARRNAAWSVEGSGVTSSPLFAAYNDGTTVYAVGAQGAWLEKPVSTSGNKWHLVNNPAAGMDLYTVVGRTGATPEVWAFGLGCSALKKSNGTFSVQSIPGCFSDIGSAWMGSDGEIYLASISFDGLIFHRSGGKWSIEPLGILEPVYGVAVQGNDAWALAMSGQLFHRVAGTWRQESQSLTVHDLNAAYASPEGDVFMVGGGGLIWHRR